MDLIPCPFCGDDEPEIRESDGTYWVACLGCIRTLNYHYRSDAIAAWNRRATDLALLALAKLGARVLDWSPLECGFPTIPGSVIDAMAVRSGCAREVSGDGGHACWTAPNVKLAIAALLAPDGADGAGEVAP